MRNVLAILEFHRFVSQQAQARPGVTFGRSGTRKGSDTSALQTVKPDGRPARAQSNNAASKPAER
jgi:hypothetical protein